MLTLISPVAYSPSLICGSASPIQHLNSLTREQLGVAGDMTASRKARVFEVPVEQAYAMSKRKEKPPEHLANSLYLEWFSETNGRVVIESADYQVTISPPEWQLTPEENEQRAHDAAQAMTQFLGKLEPSDRAASPRSKGPGRTVERARLRTLHERVRRAHR